MLSASKAPILSLCHEIHSKTFLIKLNLLAKHHEEILSHPELCVALENRILTTKVDPLLVKTPSPFSPGLSGVGKFRLHKDQVRSRETANRSRASGEKAI